MARYYGTNGRDVFNGGRRGEAVYGLDGNDDLYGAGGDDRLFGGRGNDLLVGGHGTDRLYGGAGSDLLDGGKGNDTLDGGSGFDYADYFYAAAGVSVNLAAGTAADGEGGTDTLASIEGVYGSKFADYLVGNAGTNELFGERGNDVLIGGAGQDLTVGGAGADIFRFADGDISGARARADLIGDFSRAEGDQIDLAGIDANPDVAGDQAFTFIGRDAFTGTAGELRYAFIAGETVLSTDLDGDKIADGYIRLADAPHLVPGDFIF